MAAGLVAMAGRFSSKQLSDHGSLVAEADALRARVTPLADADADAYAAVLAALSLPKEPDAKARADLVRKALSDAADVPLAMVEVAADVARLAGRLAREGNSNLRGDAVTASTLSSAGARAAALLVAENLVRMPDDPRSSRASDLARLTEEVASSTVAFVTSAAADRTQKEKRRQQECP